jgi:flagellar hook assembly protein FlgD
MSDVDLEDKQTGRYRIKYTLSTANSKAPVYSQRLRIRATDSFGRAAVDSSRTLTVLATTSDVPGLSVDVNSFDPTASESVKITLGVAGRGATVDVYNIAGTLVRTLETGQATTVSWNGRNDSGEIVASGVYFLNIRTSAGDATRTVAVLK